MPDLRAWRQRGLDVLYPRRCQGCSQTPAEGEHYLCWDCRNSLIQVDPPLCHCCGAPAAGVIDHAYRCFDCSTRTVHFDQARSPWIYDGMARDLICRLKYAANIWMLDDFGRWLGACYETFYTRVEIDCVTWVPLHWSRRLKRGFNQSALLTQALQTHCPALKIVKVLKKTKNTPSQTRLTASQRLTNVKGSFRIHHPESVSGAKILLVDDVMTTGSTVNEAARVLKDAGAEGVYVMTLARGGS